VVDVFYVTDSSGGLLTDPEARRGTVAAVLSALRSQLPPRGPVALKRV
jgi:hypothetical protein